MPKEADRDRCGVRMEKWNTVRKSTREQGYNAQDSDMEKLQTKARRPNQNIEVKGVVGYSAVSPLKLTNELKGGNKMHASILQNGMIAILCMLEMQQAKALKIKNVLGRGAEVFKPRVNTEVKGLMYNVCHWMFQSKRLTSLKGGDYKKNTQIWSVRLSC